MRGGRKNNRATRARSLLGRLRALRRGPGLYRRLRLAVTLAGLALLLALLVLPPLVSLLASVLRAAAHPGRLLVRRARLAAAAPITAPTATVYATLAVGAPVQALADSVLDYVDATTLLLREAEGLSTTAPDNNKHVLAVAVAVSEIREGRGRWLEEVQYVFQSLAVGFRMNDRQCVVGLDMTSCPGLTVLDSD